MCLLILAITLVFFATAYKLYGSKIFKLVELDNSNKTPAMTHGDGIEYVPAPKSVLMGHHFSSIAGAAPIIGPITAAAYGWAPVFLWILLGCVFIGCVHDFTSLIISVRHQGQSIGSIIEDSIGKIGKFIFVVFCWSTLILIVAVFMVVVTKTFLANPATITASILYLTLAVLFGLLSHKLGISANKLTPIFVPLLGISIWLGIKYPLIIPAAGIAIPFTTIVMTPFVFCIIILMAYIFVASVTPVWVLLQPRDYLSSFLLYFMIILAFIGICVARPEIKMPAFQSYSPEKLGMMFPMLFVVVACGAISGFHAIVGSGTTSKQLMQENDAKVVGFGSMLVEGVLAVMALIMVLKLDLTQYNAQANNPIMLFSEGFGSLMPSLHISAKFGATFATLAISAFALTTLDTATRLSRLSLQDLVSKTDPETKFTKKYLDRYSATIICTILAGLLALSGEWKTVWPLFGAANQLLAAIALLTITLWLYHLKRNILYTLIPTCFMFIVSLTALSFMLKKCYHKIIELKQTLTLAQAEISTIKDQLHSEYIVVGFTILLFSLSIVLLVLAVKSFRSGKNAEKNLSQRRKN